MLLCVFLGVSGYCEIDWHPFSSNKKHKTDRTENIKYMKINIYKAEENNRFYISIGRGENENPPSDEDYEIG